MEMFGGLTKTSSRIAIAAAFGMSLGGYAMSTPAMAADLGGDCCADLEERVAELEATTVRKGNKKVSLTISGWVTKSANWWDDGAESNLYFGDKGTTLSSHFQLSGSAVIAPGWSGGYTMSVEAPGTNFGFASNQFNPGDNDGFQQIQTLLSYMWVKSDSYGTLNWGLLSQATDNVALLPDLSGTIIESNAVFFEGGAFQLRPSGNNTESGLANG
ncbi:MAG: porin, partial [Methyloceanibacter sp.]|nr:porin [Methyloceanibacter sp.]